VLDRLRSLSYIGACAVVAACRPHLEPLLPALQPPVDRDSAVAWAAATLPHRATAVRFRWKYRDEDMSAAGRGQVRMAPPDSLRLDYAATFGLKTGAGVVVGDSIRWADPESDFRALVPAIPMLWAALGYVRPAARRAMVTGGRLGRSGMGGWALRVVTGADTLEYELSEGHAPELRAQWRRAGRMVAASRTRFGPDGRAATARMDFPEGAARFELTVVAVDTAAVIAPVLWHRRR